MKRVALALLFSVFAVPLWAGPVDESVDAVLLDYFKIQSALAQDTTKGVDAAAQSIQEKVRAADAEDVEVRKLLDQIQTAAGEMQSKDLETTRNQFFELSRPILVYLNKFHAEKQEYFRYYCSMANKAWIQPDKGVRNPYHGSSMLTCGELIE